MRFLTVLNSDMSLCCFVVCSEIHSFMTVYTGTNEQTAAGTREFSAVTTLDEEPIDYYDSDTKKLMPIQDWMKDSTYKDMWKRDTEIREEVQQIYKNNIPVLMQRFNQSGGELKCLYTAFINVKGLPCA